MQLKCSLRSLIIVLVVALAANFFVKREIHQRARNINLEQKIKQEQVINDNYPNKYAVLISGDTEDIYQENLSMAYQILLENGFQRKNVSILGGKGDLSAFYPIFGPASKKSIDCVFDDLSKKIDSNDLLFVYVTGHGDQITLGDVAGDKKEVSKIASIDLSGESLLETDFEKYLINIKSEVGILLFDQCYGGNFAKRFGKGNYIAISASEPGKTSKENTFPWAFFHAWRNYDFSDRNNDGKISIGEAFYHAKQHDISTRKGLQKPQIYSDINEENIFLGD